MIENNLVPYLSVRVALCNPVKSVEYSLYNLFTILFESEMAFQVLDRNSKAVLKDIAPYFRNMMGALN
jgi:hypothetical protein